MIQDLEKTLEYIENNITKNISIKKLSKYVGISEFYLQRSFYNRVGIVWQIQKKHKY